MLSRSDQSAVVYRLREVWGSGVAVGDEPLSLTANSLRRARLGWRVVTFTPTPPKTACTCKWQLQVMNEQQSIQVSSESRN